jgi:hypothetical protein
MDCVKFRTFRRELFHVTLSKILESLRPGMTCPEVVLCFDGHYRRAIYSIGPYIADYPEQALVACIVQGWCPRYGLVLIDRCSRSLLIHACRVWYASIGQRGLVRSLCRDERTRLRL